MAYETLTGMPEVSFNKTGDTVRFTLRGQSARHEFQIHPVAILQIAQQFLGAYEECATRNPALVSTATPAVEIQKWEASGDDAQQVVSLKLFPTPNAGLSYCLPVDAMERLSNDLATVVARVSQARKARPLSS